MARTFRCRKDLGTAFGGLLYPVLGVNPGHGGTRDTGVERREAVGLRQQPGLQIPAAGPSNGLKSFPADFEIAGQRALQNRLRVGPGTRCLPWWLASAIHSVPLTPQAPEGRMGPLVRQGEAAAHASASARG